MPKISLKERKKLDRFHEQRKAKLRKKYPEIHGKKLDYITHSYEDNDGGGWLYVNLYFTDGTNLSMDFSLNNPAIVPRMIEYGDMSTGTTKTSAHITTGGKSDDRDRRPRTPT
jgi:hypothetical protein